MNIQLIRVRSQRQALGVALALGMGVDPVEFISQSDREQDRGEQEASLVAQGSES